MFTVRAVKCYLFLFQRPQVQPIAKQFMRAATSIWANRTEAQNAQTSLTLLQKCQLHVKRRVKRTIGFS